MQKNSKTAALCRAGIIAALYAALTYAFGSLSFGPFQIRPAEALCILPLLFWEAVPGVFVGCMLGNLASGFGLYDIIFGSLTTLLAAALTFAVGRLLGKKCPKTRFIEGVKVVSGGFFPVILNALLVPLIIIFASPTGGGGAYAVYFAQMLLTEAFWVYGMGTPIYFGLRKFLSKPL